MRLLFVVRTGDDFNVTQEVTIAQLYNRGIVLYTTYCT